MPEKTESEASAQIERLLQANEELAAQLDAAESESELLAQQLAATQQQLAASQAQLAASAADTEEMVPIGEHWFAPASIRSLTWSYEEPDWPTLCVDGVTVWRVPKARPPLMTEDYYQQMDDPETERKQKADYAAWQQANGAAAQEILRTINAAKRALAGRRQQGGRTP